MKLILVLTLILFRFIINFIKGGGLLTIDTVPIWMENLDEEDVSFIKRFLLASGSLKEIANQYGVSYPTVRLRLDRLIQKIELEEDAEGDPYVSLIKRFVLKDKLDYDVARTLILQYKKTRRK